MATGKPRPRYEAGEANFLVRPGVLFPSRPCGFRQHGAQGRLKDDRHFGGRPQGLSLTGRAPCYALAGRGRCRPLVTVASNAGVGPVPAVAHVKSISNAIREASAQKSLHCLQHCRRARCSKGRQMRRRGSSPRRQRVLSPRRCKKS